VQRLDPDQMTREEWDRWLDSPLYVGQKPTQQQLEQEGEDFMAALGVFGGR
jgi:hypothetical protein